MNRVATARPDRGEAGADGRALALIVDDAPTIRLYHARTLEQCGFRVREAADGVEGLEAALLERPDLLLVDINMPRMDGFSLLRAMRAEPELAHVPAIMISTEREGADADAAFAAGANLFLAKPADPERLARLARLFVGRPLT